MTTSPPPRREPSAESLASALATAEVPPLLSAVAHLTGDLSLLRPEFAPDQEQLLVPGRGLAPDQEEAARSLAAAALRRAWHHGRPACGAGI